MPGRDAFFTILRMHDRLLQRRKAQAPHTTYSKHDYSIQPNLFKDLVLTRPLQAFVSDITYLRVGRRFAYLFLVTDAFSKRIMGYHLSHTLEHQGAINALHMSIKDIRDPGGIIHHSDRGVQYCCHQFLDALKTLSMRSSMTDANHCAQNALAERMNGILKNEFYLDLPFLDFKAAHKAVAQAVLLYNEERTHGSLKMNGKMSTPEVYHFAALAA